MRSRWRFLPITVLGMLLALSSRAAAQDSTPVDTAFPVAPDPAECRVEPRTADEMLALVALATPTVADSSTTTVVVPIGAPADAATSQAVIDVVRESVACLSAGDVPRFFALFTDGLVRRAAEEPSPLTAEDVRLVFALDPTEVAPARPVTLLAVTDIVVLSDGRVGAFVVTDNPYEPSDPPTTQYWMFARIDGRWLLDGDVEFARDEYDAGTPTS